jgi:membrane associated rhomboid family serine protease
VFVYFAVQPHGQTDMVTGQVEEAEFTYSHAAVPKEVVDGHPLNCGDLERSNTVRCSPGVPPDREPFPDKNVYLAILYSMFLHGSLLHIGGNMLFLWIFGNNIEDRMGKVGYAAFYLAGGAVAAATHILLNADSTIPVVGASGAIAAVMGAYLVLFPNAPVLTAFIFFFVFLREVPAKWLLVLWFVSQFFIGPSEGVAWSAHVGGFVFGVVAGWLLRERLRPPASLAGRY